MKKTALFFAALLMTPSLFAVTHESITSILDMVPKTAQRLFEEGVKLQDKRVDVTVMKIKMTLVYESSRINENVICYRFAKEKMTYGDQAQMDILKGMGVNNLNPGTYYCQAEVDLTLRPGQE